MGGLWPQVSPALVALWRVLARFGDPPEACLINFYGAHAKMGQLQDRDELEFDAPVLWVSLGDSCLFRLGGRKRNDPTRSIRLSSGDVLVLGGASRHALQGVGDYPGTSSLLREGGRINLTLRRVTRSGPDLRTDQIPSAEAPSENKHDLY